MVTTITIETFVKINSFANCLLPNGLLLSTKGKVHPCDFNSDDDGKIFNVGLKLATRCFPTTSEIIAGMPDVCR